jgi:hypothetical protein
MKDRSRRLTVQSPNRRSARKKDDIFGVHQLYYGLLVAQKQKKRRSLVGGSAG